MVGAEQYLSASIANMAAAATIADDIRLRRALESLACNLFWTGVEMMGRSRQAGEHLPAPFDPSLVGGDGRTGKR